MILIFQELRDICVFFEFITIWAKMRFKIGELKNGTGIPYTDPQYIGNNILKLYKMSRKIKILETKVRSGPSMC